MPDPNVRITRGGVRLGQHAVLEGHLGQAFNGSGEFHFIAHGLGVKQCHHGRRLGALMGQGWLRGRRPIKEDEVRWVIHEPLRYWQLFGLLDEPNLGRSRGLDAPWTISFTPVGRLAALTFLHDLATSDDAH